MNNINNKKSSFHISLALSTLLIFDQTTTSNPVQQPHNSRCQLCQYKSKQKSIVWIQKQSKNLYRNQVKISINFSNFFYSWTKGWWTKRNFQIDLWSSIVIGRVHEANVSWILTQHWKSIRIWSKNSTMKESQRINPFVNHSKKSRQKIQSSWFISHL